MKRFARQLRREQTPHEAQLWSLLRDRRFIGYRFRRQVPIGPFIADFVCQGRRLIVELDGSQHADDPKDAVRDAELRRRGYRVLRIWNNELTENRGSVLEAIWHALRESIGNDVSEAMPSKAPGHLSSADARATGPRGGKNDSRLQAPTVFGEPS